MPDLIALSIPCDDNGSKREAASPTTNQPSPTIGSSKRELVERTETGLDGLQPFVMPARERVLASCSCHTSGSESLSLWARSASVTQQITRLAFGKPAVYHQPSAKASIINCELDSPPSKNRDIPSRRSTLTKRAPAERAKEAEPPVASTTNLVAR